MFLQKLGEVSPELPSSSFLRFIAFRTPHFPHEHGHHIRPRRMVHIQPRCFEACGAQEAEVGAKVALDSLGFTYLFPFTVFIPDAKYGELVERRGGFLRFPILCHN
jgi:hypothetical protein